MAAGQDALQKLIGKAMIDPVFREYLLRDPMAAAASIGIVLSEQQVARIKALDPKSLQVIVAGFDAGTGMGYAAARPLW
jgi:hypothetical protein